MTDREVASVTKSPVFLVGSERSGTTLLRLMLDHHSEVAFQSEFEFSVELVSDSGVFPEIGTYRTWLSLDRVFIDSGFRIDPSLDFPELVDSFLVQKRDQSRKPNVGATVHRHFDRLLDVWPDARFIHLLRDPRDVARSTIPMGFAGNLWAGAARWVEAETTWSVLREKLSEDRWIELHYEDLIREPEARLGELCLFLGVSYDPGMLEYSESSSYGPPDPSVAERWRGTLTERDLGLIEGRVGSLLEERGYQPSGAPAIEVTPGLVRKLQWEDRIGKLRFRIKRYGPALFLAELVARRAGIKPLHTFVMMRMHDITRQHLR